MTPVDYASLISRVCELGAHRAAVIDVSAIRFERSFRTLCEQNSCGNYGQCWMCPPYVGDIDALIAQAQTYQKALVYQTVGQLEDSYDFEGMMEAARQQSCLAQTLSPLFCSLPFPRMRHLSAGGCHVCESCAKRTGASCRHPDRALPSLEAYGIAVSDLARASGMNYINGPHTVTYFGALLFCEP